MAREDQVLFHNREVSGGRRTVFGGVVEHIGLRAVLHGVLLGAESSELHALGPDIAVEALVEETERSLLTIREEFVLGSEGFEELAQFLLVLFALLDCFG